MNKIISAAGIAFALLFFTGFKGVEKTTETTESSVIPKEKRELLKKIVGRWITQTNIYARNGKPASKVIGSDIWQWSPDGNFTLHMDEDGKTLTVKHEITGDGKTYEEFMDGVLKKGSDY